MFNDFIDLAQREGVTNEENFPFWLEPETPAHACVVLVHGFSATPREMRPLANTLLAHGFATLGVRLPGHGTTPEDLSRRSYREWVATVRAALEIAGTRAPRVYAAGLSTGALSLIAASTTFKLHGMVLMVPFLRLNHPLASFAWILRYLFRYETRDIEEELKPFYYARRPLKAIHQLMLLVAEVRRVLPQITTPALVMASEGDQTADHQSAKRLFEKLGSQTKAMKMFGAEVPHNMLGGDNPKREEVIQRCLDFLLEREAAS